MALGSFLQVGVVARVLTAVAIPFVPVVRVTVAAFRHATAVAVLVTSTVFLAGVAFIPRDVLPAATFGAAATAGLSYIAYETRGGSSGRATSGLAGNGALVASFVLDGLAFGPAWAAILVVLACAVGVAARRAIRS